MPIYEYICKNCSHKFEILIRGEEKSVCPKCRGTKLTRLFSTFSAMSSSRETLSSCRERTPYCPEGPCPGGTCPKL